MKQVLLSSLCRGHTAGQRGKVTFPRTPNCQACFLLATPQSWEPSPSEGSSLLYQASRSPSPAPSSQELGIQRVSPLEAQSPSVPWDGSWIWLLSVPLTWTPLPGLINSSRPSSVLRSLTSLAKGQGQDSPYPCSPGLAAGNLLEVKITHTYWITNSGWGPAIGLLSSSSDHPDALDSLSTYLLVLNYQDLTSCFCHLLPVT